MSNTQKMKAAFINNTIFGAIRVGEKPRPKLTSRQIQIKMNAASINPIDWRFIKLIMPVYPFSLILGHDGAGQVTAVGSKVTKFKVGDWVYGLKVWSFRGSFAEYFNLDENNAAIIPSSVDVTTAAAMPLVSLTALQAYRWSNLQAGQHVLVIGGSGGVGHVAIQIAKAQGAKVTAVCSSKNVAWVKSLGADAVVDYSQEKVIDVVSDVDMVFDMVGEHSYGSLQSIMTENATFVTTYPTLRAAFNLVLAESLGRFFPRFRKSWFVLLQSSTADLEEVADLVNSGKLKIHIDRVFTLDQAFDAIEASKQSRTVGKNILQITTNH